MDNSQNNRKDVYSIVTERIIRLLQNGVIPWKQPWTSAGLPRNLVTKKPYRGINLWLLNSLGYSSNCFLTLRQLEEIGGTVKKDEKANLVVFWNRIEDENEEPDSEEHDEVETKTRKRTILRYYFVFNIMQCEGIPERLIAEQVEQMPEVNPILTCENIVSLMPEKPLIKYEMQEAFYHPLYDFINMPKMKTFNSMENYYGTLFHELVHSTGHVKRLGRKGVMEQTTFGTIAYSQEELIAEMGSCYLKYIAGIQGEKEEAHSASYINAWIKVLNDDHRFVILAGAQAQKAVDYILNIRFETEVDPEEAEPQKKTRKGKKASEAEA